MGGETEAASGGVSRIYVHAGRPRIVAALVMAALCVLSLAGLGFATFVVEKLSESLILGGISLLFLGAAGIGLADLRVWKMTLSGEEMKTRDLLGTRSLTRAQIAGYRRANRRRGLVLVANDPALKAIRIPGMLPLDACLLNWLRTLPDLDAKERLASLAGIETDPRYGATREKRLKRLRRVRKVVGGINLAMVAVLLWGLIQPRPYALSILILAAIPPACLALTAAFRGLVFICERRNDVRADLGSVFILPGMILMIRTLLDLNMANWWTVILAGVLVGAALIAAGAAIDRGFRQRPWLSGVYVLVLGCYGFGVVAEANALLDRNPAALYRTPLLEKHVSNGKTKTYRFVLAPWGHMDKEEELTVPHGLYDRVESGEMVCVVEHPGAFGLRWFIPQECPSSRRLLRLMEPWPKITAWDIVRRRVDDRVPTLS